MKTYAYRNTIVYICPYGSKRWLTIEYCQIRISGNICTDHTFLKIKNKITGRSTSATISRIPPSVE